MTIVHVLLFEFKPTVDAQGVEDVCQRLLALKDKCVNKSTGKPYIKSFRGGKNNSPEGHAGGFTHAFISEFETEEDRKYYLEEDPAHLEFVKSLDGIVQTVRVVDFTPGVF